MQIKEKDIENSIKKIIQDAGRRCQKVQSGSLIIAAGEHNRRRIKLADQGTPDLIACIDGVFIGIEVKKNPAELKKRKKLYDRQATGEELPLSYEREKAQIEHALRIQKSGGIFIIVSSSEEFVRILNENLQLWKKSL